MAISRNLPSKTLEEIMAEVTSGQPVDPELLGSAQVLPPPGQSLPDEPLFGPTGDQPWVEIVVPGEGGGGQ